MYINDFTKLTGGLFVWSPSPFGSEGKRIGGEGSPCSWCHPELPHVPSALAAVLWSFGFVSLIGENEKTDRVLPSP